MLNPLHALKKNLFKNNFKAITTQLHHVEISAKSNKTSFNYLKYVIDNLLKCLSETQGAAVALTKRKT